MKLLVTQNFFFIIFYELPLEVNYFIKIINIYIYIDIISNIYGKDFYSFLMRNIIIIIYNGIAFKLKIKGNL